MSIIGGRWKSTIICMLGYYGTLRFSELKKMMGNITSRILTKQLRELERDGMISRDVLYNGKIKVQY